MLKDLPAFIDPLRLAQEDCVLRGQIAVEQFSRILESLCNTQGEASFEWLFTTNEQQQPIVTGWIKAPLQMTCQRCLQPMTWQVETSVSLVILTDEQSEDSIPADCEALVITKVPVSLVTLIEDEIILALPIATLHRACPASDYGLPSGDEEGMDQYSNPFKILKMLKN